MTSDVGADQTAGEREPIYELPSRRSSKKLYPHHKIIGRKRFLAFSTPKPTDVIKWFNR
jgi:hypothetical protein